MTSVPHLYLQTLTIHAKISAPVRNLAKLGLVLILSAATSLAADRAILRNGFVIEHERHQVIGEMTRLYTSDGYVDIPTADIVSYEHVDDPPPMARPAPELAPQKTIQDHVFDASKTTGIDPDFLNSVIHYESDYNPHAVSKKGAQGLMQLMPDTANKLGVSNSFDPGQNVQGGASYLRQLLDTYHGDAQKALAAYNAGPGRVQQYKGVPPYRETQAYVAAIIREYNRKKLAEQAAAKKSLDAKKKSAPRKPEAKREAKQSTTAEPGSQSIHQAPATSN